MKYQLRTLFASLLGIALLAWFLLHANLTDVFYSIRGASIGALLMATVLVVLIMLVRSVRWQYLLAPLGQVSFRAIFRTTMIGLAASNILPARAGEFLRPYLLARQEGLSATSTFATIVIERILDLVSILLLLGIFVIFSGRHLFLSSNMQAVEISAILAMIVTIILGVMMWFLASNPDRIGLFVLKIAKYFPRGLAKSLSKLAQTFSEGLAVVRAPSVLVVAFICSVVLWLTIAVQVYLVSIAFGIDMLFTGSFLLQAILAIGVSVPTPGAVGSFHEAYRIGATTFFGASNADAVAAALILHGISFMPVTILGILFMMQDGFSLHGLSGLTNMRNQEKDSN
jgi:uncharacterized protein (TIRG00374 family)